MKKIVIAASLLSLSLVGTVAYAGDAEKLIKLDKAWGEAKGPDEAKALLAEKFVSVNENGIGNTHDLMEAMAADGPPDGPYVAGDYDVRFLNDKVAVMVHSAGSGDDKHWSMHVWRKHDGHWKVYATSSVPAGD